MPFRKSNPGEVRAKSAHISHLYYCVDRQQNEQYSVFTTMILLLYYCAAHKNTKSRQQTKTTPVVQQSIALQYSSYHSIILIVRADSLSRPPAPSTFAVTNTAAAPRGSFHRPPTYGIRYPSFGPLPLPAPKDHRRLRLPPPPLPLADVTINNRPVEAFRLRWRQALAGSPHRLQRH